MQKYEKMSTVRAYEINKTLIPEHFGSCASQSNLFKKALTLVGVFLLFYIQNKWKMILNCIKISVFRKKR